MHQFLDSHRFHSACYLKLKHHAFHNVNAILTGNITIAILQSTKVRHELPDGDFKDFKQTRVLEQSVRHLRERRKQNKT